MAVIKNRVGRQGYTNTTHTRALVEFHSDQNPNREVVIVGPGPKDTAGGPSGLLGHLVSIQVHKGFDGPSGSFTIVVKKPPTKHRQDSLLRVWREPEDVWVKIFYIVEGQKFHRMTGLVDTFSESMVRDAGGKRVETYTITGRDEGKIFETMDLWLNSYVFGADKLPKSIVEFMAMFNDKAFSNGTPSDWIRWALESWLGNNGLASQQWTLPTSMGGSSFYDKLLLGNIQKPLGGSNGRLGVGDATFFNVDLLNGFGRLWDYLSHYSNDLLNEMWIDLIGNEPGNLGASLPTAIYLRQRPFPTMLSGRKNWESIRSHVLERYDISSRQLSKGGAANRYNFWSLIPEDKELGMDIRNLVANGNLDAADFGQPGSIPIWNEESIAKHGIRRWEKSTIWISGLVEDGDGGWPNMLANWLRLCHDWYSVAPMQLSGTIQGARLFPEIRIGHRLIERRDEGDIEYYVEGVDDSWWYPGSGSTAFTVTRGQYLKEDLLSAVYKQMRHPDIPKLQDCSLGNPVEDAILEGCKFTVVDTSGDSGISVGSGFISPNTQDLAPLEKSGAGLVSEGAKAPTNMAQPDPKMIPPHDVENAQAADIDSGNHSAAVRKPPGQPYNKAALERGEDPLAGYDADDLDSDPIAGL